MIVRALVLAGLLPLVAAAPAGAARVTFTPYSEPPGTVPEDSCSRYAACPAPTLSVVDERGERNDVSVEPFGGTIVVRDAAAPLETAAPCTRRDDGSVACPGGAAMSVLAGAGDDRVVAPFAAVHGGAGNDELTGITVRGQDGDDRVTGTDQANELEGGEGIDVVDGGAGEDIVVDFEQVAAPDRLTGGDGGDTISFRGRAAPVRVDLSSSGQQAGAPGEENVVTGFERAIGGEGDDELLGPDQAVSRATLAGGGGNDRLVGRTGDWIDLDGGAGDDVLTAAAAMGFYQGGPGADVLSGGDGNDQMGGGSGRDELNGGGGDDSLEGEGGPDEVIAGDGDDLATGGTGDDAIVGGDGDDRISGGRGDDELSGGFGRDRIVGGRGLDLLLGGPGGDSLSARDRRLATVRCGGGSDSASVDRRERARGCERVSRLRRRR